MICADCIRDVTSRGGGGPILVLLNPLASGGVALRWRPRIEAALLALGAVAEVHVSASVDDSCHWLAARPGRRVVLVGGDGSVGPLLPTLLAGGHTLGLIPAGTGNDFARALGLLGQGLESALQHAVRGPARPIDLGQVRWSLTAAPPDEFVPIDKPAPTDPAPQTVLFASSLTVGFDSVVAYRAETSRHRLPGQLHYLWATLAELRVLNAWPIRLTTTPALPDQDAAAPQALHLASVLNTASYGGGMPVAPTARIDDGQLQLLRLCQTTRPRLLRLLHKMLRGRHLGEPEVRQHRFTRLTMHCDKPLPLGADGNFIGQARWLEVCCLPAALPVVTRP